MINDQPLRVVVFCPNRVAVSETFIDAHITRLPFLILSRYGSKLDIEDSLGRKIWAWGFWFDLLAGRAQPKVHRLLTTIFLARHLRRLKADAVLAEYGTTGAHLAPACARAKVPLFVHFHGFDASTHEVIDGHKDSYQYMFSSAAGIVAVSCAMKKKLLSLGAREAKLHLNHCGVDPTKFHGARPEISKPNFLAVGRFVEKKAPHITILAFSRLINVVPEAKLTFIGIGPLFGPCQRLVQALNLEESVQLLGVRGQDEISRLMSESRAFVQHSLVAATGDSEGTPVAIIEAQMSGLPVVATRHAGIPDVVIDGETGFLSAEADAEGMARAMIRLAKSPSLAARMGVAARERAKQCFTIDRHINQLADMIRSGVQPC